MDLDQIFSANNIDIDKARIKMIRHVPRHEIDWIMIKKGYFNEYQSIQGRSTVMNKDYVLSFLVDEKDRTIFKGLYQVDGHKIYDKSDLPIECIEAWPPSGTSVFFKIQKTDYLNDLVDRLVIDWGDGKRKWDQNYHNRQVNEIMPKGFLEVFPGYLDVSLEWNELEKIIQNPQANNDWKVALSKINAVYLILDEKSGMQYIGSAYGKDGLWQRWSNYIRTKSGDNNKLTELLESHPERFLDFRFSIIEVLPATLNKDEVIARESAVKRKLGTRAFGLNLN